MAKEMLLVVDYQYDFVYGSLGFEGAGKLEDGIAKEIENAKAKGNVVVFTRDTHTENYLSTREGRNLPIEHTIRGTRGWMLYGKVGELASEDPSIIIIDKKSFAMSPEQALSLPEGITKVRIVGLVSNICVISNAVMMQARYPEADIEVVENLTDSFDRDTHDAAMKVLKGIQVKVV